MKTLAALLLCISLCTSCNSPPSRVTVPAATGAVTFDAVGDDETGGAPVGQQKAPLLEHQVEMGVMGTELIITVYGPDLPLMREAVTAAVDEMRRVEDLMTDWRPSPLTELNEAAGSGPRQVPRELAAIIARGVAVGELTGGAFDISYAAVGKLWSFKAGEVRRPTAEQVAAALPFVDSQRIVVDPATYKVLLPENMSVGLGGIAKGYGVDRAMTVLMEHGVKHAMVNAGGDLKVLGLKQGQPWRLALKHPRRPEHALAVLSVTNGCVVTSGDYERFFEEDGQRFHHILDPRTGHPATGCISATVTAPSAELADALATALCVLGPEKGLKLLARVPRAEGLMVDLAGGVHASPGLAGSVLDRKESSRP